MDRPAGGRLWSSSGLCSQIPLVGPVLETAKVRGAVCWVHRVLAAVGPIVTGAWLPGPGPQRLTVGGPVSWAAQQAEVPSLSA